MGLVPLCIALVLYLYLDFSPRVDSTLSGPGLIITYIIGVLGVIGLIGIIMGPKIDASKNNNS